MAWNGKELSAHTTNSLIKSNCANQVVTYTGAHSTPDVLGHGIRGADPKFFGGGSIGGEEGQTRQQTCVEKHLTAANCLYISGFFAPRPHRGYVPGPHWGLPFPRPSVPTLISEPGYATGSR